MAYLNSVSKEPMRDDPNHHLTHRASNISALSDFDSNPYDAPAHTLIPRESMVSLDSRRGQYTSAETYGMAVPTALTLPPRRPHGRDPGPTSTGRAIRPSGIQMDSPSGPLLRNSGEKRVWSRT
ncbi:hypothetical protein V2G26_008490 [Clonostachys chloroleuca]